MMTTHNAALNGFVCLRSATIGNLRNHTRVPCRGSPASPIQIFAQFAKAGSHP